MDSVLDLVPRLSQRARERIRDAAAQPGLERIDQLKGHLADLRREYWWLPIVQVVAALPKDELAAMAESLVNLTALKRKISMETETVGGPIDVAVISKGDGFVWVKRKKYFELDENPHVLEDTSDKRAMAKGKPKKFTSIGEVRSTFYPNRLNSLPVRVWFQERPLRPKTDALASELRDKLRES